AHASERHRPGRTVRGSLLFRPHPRSVSILPLLDTYMERPRHGAPMRRIVVFNNVSADGCFSDAEGKLDWVVNDPDLTRANASAARSSGDGGAELFGRRTYE